MAGLDHLYVCGLPEGLDAFAFRQLFESYGAVVSSEYAEDKCHGFVKFSTPAEAKRVVDNVNGSAFGQSTITVRYADSHQGLGAGEGAAGGEAFRVDGGDAATGSWVGPQQAAADDGRGLLPHQDDQIYITGLPLGLTDEQLVSIFGAYGAIKAAQLLRLDGRQDAVGLVQMGAAEEAAWLVNNLNGNVPQGLATIVGVYFASAQRHDSDGGKGGARYSPYGVAAGDAGGVRQEGIALTGLQLGGTLTVRDGDESNLYVKGLPVTTDELYLYKLFAPFGAIQSVRPVASERDAIGFVKFLRPTDAARAIALLSGQLLPDGNTIRVSVKKAKRKKDE